jgi:hypothetical protein
LGSPNDGQRRRDGAGCLLCSVPAFTAKRHKPKTNNKTQTMKNQLLTIIALLGLVSVPSFAESKGKEITVKGEAQCAKCNLKTATECQTVIISEKDGRKTTYHLAANDVAKKFHEEVCKAPKAASVTATCKKEGDRLVLTASKAEVTK